MYLEKYFIRSLRFMGIVHSAIISSTDIFSELYILR